MSLLRLASLALVFTTLACGTSRREGDEDGDPQPTPGACGNGTVDTGETCDKAIESGAGACPTTCDDGDPCTVDGRGGSVDRCTSKCVNSPKQGDPNCVASCGNGKKEAGEACDGDCPTACDDGDPCTTDTLTGSECSVKCAFAPIPNCGEQPATCGNGRVDSGETCDKAIAAGSAGACPTSCGPANGCSRAQIQGTAAACSATCAAVAVTACANGDSCCPTGCTGANDSDCGSTPTSGAIGSECTAPEQCNSQACITERLAGWPGGYCSKTCQTDSVCGGGAHCVAEDGETACRANCTTDAQCRAGYKCLDVDQNGSKECVQFAGGVGLPGQSCQSALTCGGGTDGWCLMPERGWKDGYCARLCSSAQPCPTGSHCTPDGVCLADCSTARPCRGAGYTCTDIDGDAKSECFASGTGTSRVGDGCPGLWACSGGTLAECLSEWPGGYCSKGCSQTSPCLTSGEACVTFNDTNTSRCLRSCGSNADCRAGYTCHALDGGTKVCIPAE